MLASPLEIDRRGSSKGMKKGIVFLLIALALIVLISPGLIGQFAERNMDRGIRAGAVENEEVIVSAEAFERGWFTTEGQHRIEFKDGSLAQTYRDFFALGADAPLPVLIVDTRIDHGLIPIASMGRDDGSLFPGLGDAISTLAVELPDGRTLAVPGAINSSIGLGGALFSEYTLAAGEYTEGRTTLEWGAGRIEVEAHPSDSRIEFDIEAQSFGVVDEAAAVRASNLNLRGEQQPSQHGYPLGEAVLEVGSLSVEDMHVGPLELYGSVHEENAGITIRNHTDIVMPAADFGKPHTVIELEVTGIEPDALGSFVRQYRLALDRANDPERLWSMVEPEAQVLLANGLELSIPRFEIELPDGTLEVTLELALADTDAADFIWSDLMLATTAEASIRIPVALMDTILAINPQAGAAIGMGFLKKDGDVYLSDIAYAKGVATVNGAPLAVPMPGR